jgi:hypothetical protein
MGDRESQLKKVEDYKRSPHLSKDISWNSNAIVIRIKITNAIIIPHSGQHIEATGVVHLRMQQDET